MTGVQTCALPISERIKFEEEGNMNRIKLRMDSYHGGQFTVVSDEKKKPEPIKGALNPPKEEEDDDVFGPDNKKLSTLPF